MYPVGPLLAPSLPPYGPYCVRPTRAPLVFSRPRTEPIASVIADDPVVADEIGAERVIADRLATDAGQLVLCRSGLGPGQMGGAEADLVELVTGVVVGVRPVARDAGLVAGRVVGEYAGSSCGRRAAVVASQARFR